MGNKNRLVAHVAQMKLVSIGGHWFKGYSVGSKEIANPVEFFIFWENLLFLDGNGGNRPDTPEMEPETVAQWSKIEIIIQPSNPTTEKVRNDLDSRGISRSWKGWCREVCLISKRRFPDAIRNQYANWSIVKKRSNTNPFPFRARTCFTRPRKRFKIWRFFYLQASRLLKWKVHAVLNKYRGKSNWKYRAAHWVL